MSMKRTWIAATALSILISAPSGFSLPDKTFDNAGKTQAGGAVEGSGGSSRSLAVMSLNKAAESNASAKAEPPAPAGQSAGDSVGRLEGIGDGFVGGADRGTGLLMRPGESLVDEAQHLIDVNRKNPLRWAAGLLMGVVGAFTSFAGIIIGAIGGAVVGTVEGVVSPQSAKQLYNREQSSGEGWHWGTSPARS
jgi:hypothetical protein